MKEDYANFGEVKKKDNAARIKILENIGDKIKKIGAVKKRIAQLKEQKPIDKEAIEKKIKEKKALEKSLPPRIGYALLK